MNLAGWIDGWARHRPDHAALRCEDRVVTYAALGAGIERSAAALTALGLRHGDRVALLALNRPEYITIVFACARLGLILVPLNWRLAPAEHRFQVEHAGARVLLHDAEHTEAAAAIEWPSLERMSIDAVTEGAGRGPNATADRAGMRPGDIDDPLLLVYTSGTTGRPKGAVLTQSAVQWNALNATHAHDLTAADHVLTNLPLFHVGGLNIQTLPALHAGATVTLEARFDPGETLALIESVAPTLLLMVPATMAALIAHPRWDQARLGSVRLAMAGSAPVPDRLIEAFHERGIPVGQIYGATETAPIATYLRGEDALHHVGSCGKAAVHCDVRIVGDDGRDCAAGERGEILVRGPSILTEYWSDPPATAEAIEDGWFHTGDVGHFDDEGFVHVDDRKKDVIISGGENIYPAELENVLAACETLAEYAVVGRPHERWGEVPVAIVVARADCAVDPAAVLALFDGRLARYKHPREVVRVDALPRNAMGKVLKFTLREWIESGRI